MKYLCLVYLDEKKLEEVRDSECKAYGDELRKTGRSNAAEAGVAVGLPDRRAPGPRLGDLPIARRDVDRLRQIVGLQRRLRDLSSSPRAQRALAHRHIFREALTWLDIHGDAADVVEHWKGLMADGGADRDGAEGEAAPFTRRRRRRRRRRLMPTPEQN